MKKNVLEESLVKRRDTIYNREILKLFMQIAKRKSDDVILIPYELVPFLLKITMSDIDIKGEIFLLGKKFKFN